MANTGSSNQAHLDASVPDADAIWKHRRRTVSRWSDRTGVSRGYLERHFQKLGFRLEHGGGVTHAPCAGSCDRQHPVENLNAVRLCRPCVEAGEGGVYWQELYRHRERMKESDRPRLRRTYTRRPGPRFTAADFHAPSGR